MTVRELRASLAVHERRYSAARGELAKAKKAAHAGGRRVVTKGEAAGIHRLEARVRSEKAIVDRRHAQISAARRPGIKRGTLWLPGAEKVAGRDSGVFVTAGPKIVWHTTEGSSIEGAIGAFRATGSWPTLTFDPRTGRIVQHMPLNRAARALEHPAGTVETNRAHCTQVELVGFAASTPKWDDAAYARIARLARMLEGATGTPARALAAFSATPHRLSPGEWLRGAGHCGHQHVPNNHHWDPGAFKIARVI